MNWHMKAINMIIVRTWGISSPFSRIPAFPSFSAYRTCWSSATIRPSCRIWSATQFGHFSIWNLMSIDHHIVLFMATTCVVRKAIGQCVFHYCCSLRSMLAPMSFGVPRMLSFLISTSFCRTDVGRYVWILCAWLKATVSCTALLLSYPKVSTIFFDHIWYHTNCSE